MSSSPLYRHYYPLQNQLQPTNPLRSRPGVMPQGRLKAPQTQPQGGLFSRALEAIGILERQPTTTRPGAKGPDTFHRYGTSTQVLHDAYRQTTQSGLQSSVDRNTPPPDNQIIPFLNQIIQGS